MFTGRRPVAFQIENLTRDGSTCGPRNLLQIAVLVENEIGFVARFEEKRSFLRKWIFRRFQNGEILIEKALEMAQKAIDCLLLNIKT